MALLHCSSSGLYVLLVLRATSSLYPPSSPPLPREFLELGFKYDNLLMEESAQILEIETFIPMLLQVKGAARLWQGRCWVQFCGRASAAA